MKEDIMIYSNGILACSVCVPKKLSKRVIERAVNELNPTMTSTRWKISKDKTFRTGESNPCKCNEEPGRLHYLMEC